MKIKINILLCVILSIIMVGLIILSYKIYEKRIDDILLITSNKPVEMIVDNKKMEEKNMKNYLLTYEVKTPKTISVLNKNHDVVMKGANYFYVDILHTPLVTGSFFTKKAQDDKKNVLVFNKKAAFEILGDVDINDVEIKIDDEVFTVCGVIDDKDKKNKNIYVPYTVNEDFPDINSYAAYIDKKAKNSKEEVVNHLKELSINNKVYNFYKLSDFHEQIFTRLIFSIKCTCLIGLFLYLKINIIQIKLKIKDIQILTQRYDFIDILKIKKHDFLIIILRLVTISLSVIFMMFLFLSGIEDVFFIKDTKIIMESAYSSGFSFLIENINKISLYTNFLFLSYIIILMVFFISNIFFINYKDEV